MEVNTMSKSQNNNNKRVDVHMRINKDLRNYLRDIQDFYNTVKDEDKPNIPINTLCNMSILSFKEHLESLNEVEQHRYIINKIKVL